MSIAHSAPTRRRVLMRSAAAGAAAVIALAVVGGLALAQQDKYTVTVPGGLAFSEFRGYEDWPVISISDNNGKFAAILGNPVMMRRPSGRRARRRQAFPGRRQDGENPLDPENTRNVPRSAEGARYSVQRRFHGEGQQEVRGQRWMGMGLIRLRRGVRYVQRPPPRRPLRRRATTRSAGSPATRWRRAAITFSPSTRAGEGANSSGMTVAELSAPMTSACRHAGIFSWENGLGGRKIGGCRAGAPARLAG